MSESVWIERAQNAERKLASVEGAYKPILERYQNFKANFGVKERSDGTIDVDFEEFAERIGIEGALELRKIIDERYQISGVAGEKPRIRLVADNV